MKSKIIVFFIVFTFLFSTNIERAYASESFQIKERSEHYSDLDHMNMVLKIKVYFNNEPISDAAVNFFIDNEWVRSTWTDSDGVAESANRLDYFGYHTWSIRVEKHNYNTYYSPQWKFYYEPKPFLNVKSDYGETYGTGNYTYGETATFRISNNIIELGEGKRLIFTGWTGYGANNYTGTNIENQIIMKNDIREYAEWKLQYYINMSSSLPKFVYPKSGWYDKGKIITIKAIPPDGTKFLYWNGEGNGSYSGDLNYYTIKVNNTITQKATFEREICKLDINNDKELSTGEGSFPAWENVSFGLIDEFIYITPWEREAFDGWTSSNGYSGNEIIPTFEITKDTTETANWKKQFYINIEGSEGGNSTVFHGWVDENTQINLEATTNDGYAFLGWVGTGESSYSGQEMNHNITINSPNNQTAVWKKEFSVSIDSELPATGRGNYLDGDSVTISATKSDGLIIRKVFKQWTGDISSSNNPFTFNIGRDIHATAVYEKNYTIFLGILGMVIIIVGVFFFKVMRK